MEINVPMITPSIITGETSLQVMLGDKAVNVVDQAFDCTLVQPGSVNQNPELKPYIGKFYFNDLLEAAEELKFVTLKTLPSMWSLFQVPYKPKEKPICTGIDGEFPDFLRSSAPLPGPCGRATCPKANFHENVRPECRQTVPIIFFELNYNLLFKMNISGTGLSAWNTLSKQYTTANNRAIALNKPRSNYVVKATSDNKGTYVQLLLELVPFAEDVTQYQQIISYYADFVEKNYVVKKQFSDANVQTPKAITQEDLGEELPNL